MSYVNGMKFDEKHISETNVSKEALMLLSLRSTPVSPQVNANTENILLTNSADPAIAKLEGREFEFLIRKARVVVGRNSSHGDVDVNMGHSTFVSRRHLEIVYENSNFFLKCLGKNGVFVDGVFQRRGNAPVQLPNKCTLRFPSTNMKLSFHSLVESAHEISMRNANNNKLEPLILTLGDQEHLQSPLPSPAGTISASNSCPASPRGTPRRIHGSDLTNMSEYAIKAVESVAKVQAANSATFVQPHAPPPHHSYQMQSSAPVKEEIVVESGAQYAFAQNSSYTTADSVYPLADSDLSIEQSHSNEMPRSQDEPGKGSFWKIEPTMETKLAEQAFRKRRQRGGISCFKGPIPQYLSTRTLSHAGYNNLQLGSFAQPDDRNVQIAYIIQTPNSSADLVRLSDSDDLTFHTIETSSGNQISLEETLDDGQLTAVDATTAEVLTSIGGDQQLFQNVIVNLQSAPESENSSAAPSPLYHHNNVHVEYVDEANIG